MRALLALAALTLLVQPAATVPARTVVAQSGECTGPNCPPKHECEKDEKTVS